MSRRILVTGAGGVLGTEVLAQLRARAGAGVVGVTTRGDAVRGVAAWRLGAEARPRALAGPWDVVVHCAASTRFGMTPAEARAANLGATEALDAVVGPRTHLVHVSTAFAEGLHGSTASSALADYRNAYEWSKAACERHVTARHAGVSVVRPPLIIGRRRDGHVARFDGIYAVLRAVTTGLAPATVADPDAFADMAPVDDVAARIVALAGEDPPAAPRLDVIGGGPDAMRVGDALAVAQAGINDVRARHGLVPFALPPFIDPDSWDRFHLPFARRHLEPRRLRVLELLEHFKPYLTIRSPLRVTTPVADVAPVLRRSLAVWAEQRTGAALGEPRAWSARPAA